MTDEIRLTLHTTPGQSAAAMMRAIHSSPGQGRRKLLGMALIGAGTFGGGLAMTALAGLPPAIGAAISIASLFGCVTGYIVAARLNGPALHRIQAGDWRWTQGAPLTLTPEGVVAEAKLIPWDAGQGTSRMPGVTVLHLGVIDTIAVPDADLPPGLTPEALAARIEGWRSPCAPF